MAKFEIQGGYPLHGDIYPQGAKNEALQVICACLLTTEPVTIHNIPDILDVTSLIDLLQMIGVRIQRNSRTSFTFQAENIDVEILNEPSVKEKASSLRGSIMIIGPLLARFGKGYIPRPGGDKIGRRRLDTHFIAFEKLGARFQFNPNDNFYKVDASNLQGTSILLDEASVTGTANVLMAAVFAKGTTTIYNAACEPYIQQLCRMLNRMGANISGISSNLLTVEGVHSLGGCTHTLQPDMIEVGSFIGMAAITHSDITIKNVLYDNLGIIPQAFQRLGIVLNQVNDDIHIPAQDSYEIETFIDGSILTIADAPWPGLTPDLLSIFLVVATQAKGSVLIHQKMFESRLFFVDKLIDMGARLSCVIRTGLPLLDWIINFA